MAKKFDENLWFCDPAVEMHLIFSDCRLPFLNSITRCFVQAGKSFRKNLPVKLICAESTGYGQSPNVSFCFMPWRLCFVVRFSTACKKREANFSETWLVSKSRKEMRGRPERAAANNSAQEI